MHQHQMVCKFLSSGGTRVFDNESQVPYAYKDYDWVSYEDPVSISGKAKWIKSEGYGGAMTYNLNSDDWSCVCDKTPFLLHRIIYDIFTK
ncbi:Acidic mammalian chitinase like protein [Argiope bruennichi]|uniref:Acidic mammalian chitinase like protein n=1 Tax=Argiope bruennichi TaxID=94029 RepID=A0A8T0ED79_ARGBR|nr:Acidic mammalian chitinase like protein [Argiope bruennichi]